VVPAVLWNRGRVVAMHGNPDGGDDDDDDVDVEKETKNKDGLSKSNLNQDGTSIDMSTCNSTDIIILAVKSLCSLIIPNIAMISVRSSSSSSLLKFIPFD
jgi:hypothetical protein